MTAARAVERLVAVGAGNNGMMPLPPPRRARLWFLNPLSWVALVAIAAYQRVVPSRRPQCRFVPTCSVYMSMSIRRYGLWNGTRRGLQRIRRCIGFVPRGEDWP